MRPIVLGLDVGGANLKAARNTEGARSRPFALWQQPDHLRDELQLLVEGWTWDRVALTMTGELCDCFATKREGVLAVLDAVERLTPARPIHIWTIDGCFVDGDSVRAAPLRAAASNWLAAATHAAQFARGHPAVFIDVGSTTTDVVPITNGVPTPRGRTDVQRLEYQELVYTGIRRTPICAVLGSEVMAELFATTLDVGLMLGTIADEPENRSTADGRPATRTLSHARLARMLGGDGESLVQEQTMALARRVRDRQVTIIANAIRSAADRLPIGRPTFLLAGEGEGLAHEAVASTGLRGAQVSLSQALNTAVSTSYCAHAVAELLDGRSASNVRIPTASDDGQPIESCRSSRPSTLFVVKVGGSLFAWPELGRHLRQFVAELPADQVLLVPGGGPAADILRDWDVIHHLGEEVAHWLALRVMSINAEFVSALLANEPDAAPPVVVHPSHLLGYHRVALLDTFAFCRADETDQEHLPHSWKATSDSVAARVARVARADRLILLKSCDPGGSDYVDHCFANLVRRWNTPVTCVNFTTNSTSDFDRRPAP